MQETKRKLNRGTWISFFILSGLLPATLFAQPEKPGIAFVIGMPQPANHLYTEKIAASDASSGRDLQKLAAGRRFIISPFGCRISH